MITLSDKNLMMPLDAVTQKIGFLGRTGSGKTYAAQKLAEEMCGHGAQVIILDPVGVWFGLRIASDGKSAGIEIPVFGGLHGDLPLEATAGELMANVISDRGISAVLDVSQFETDAEKNRFATGFAERFFFRRKSAPAPVFIFIEECQEFVPQNPARGDQLMLSRFTRMVKLGRNYGIGIGLISQRPQEVNKKVLNMTELMLAFQMTGPQERKTIEEWVKDKGADIDIVASLPKFEVGECHAWSPQWLKISKTVKISRKWTFNASSTPSFGTSVKVEPKPLGERDLADLRQKMADVVERAKAEDPRELRKEIADLKRKLAMTPTAPVVDVGAIEAAEQRGYQRCVADTRRAFSPLVKAVEKFASEAQALIPADAEWDDSVFEAAPPKRQPAAAPVAVRPVTHSNGVATAIGNSGLRRILVALAQKNGLSAKQIGVRAGLSSSSGTFGTYLGKCRSENWVTGSRERLEITAAGIKSLGAYDPLPMGRDLFQYWISELGESGAARMLDVLWRAYPKAVSAEKVGEMAGISSSSGTFGTYLGKLRSLELVSGDRSALRASEDLF